ncbi:MAG: glycosyltransferase family 2 protein [Acidobacteriota bacterium]
MEYGIHLILFIASWVILAYFFLININYSIFMILSLIGLFRYRKQMTYVYFKELFHFPSVKPVSIIVPAYNEEQSIIESVNSLLSLEYPKYEVIVVNDGSTDSTLSRLINYYDLKPSEKVYRKVLDTKPVRNIYISPSHSKLIVVDKENGKKADALNAGLNISRYPLFCAVDSDSLLEKEALLKVVRPFLEDPERTIASGGIIRLSNGSRVESGRVYDISLPWNLLVLFQVIEYLRAFLGGRMGLSMTGSLLVISGAFGMFRKDVALACGGYRKETVGEDMDLVVRMQKYMREKKSPYVVKFVPDPICWTEGPDSLKMLSRQRNRWHRGLVESITHSFKMFLNPRYGTTGLLAMPFYTVFEMLGPVIEVIGYAMFLFYIISGRINETFALLFFIVAVVFGTVLSLSSILLEEYSSYRYPKLRHIMRLMLAAVMENLVYRQALAFIRLKSFFDLFKGKREWGEMRKRGFAR